MLFCWTKGKMTVLGQKSGGQQNENFYRSENEQNNFGSRAGLHLRGNEWVRHCCGCGAYVCFGVWERDVELFESR